jgi:hypothetical protein
MSGIVGSVASHLSDSALKYPKVPALVSGAKKAAFAPLSFAELDLGICPISFGSDSGGY